MEFQLELRIDENISIEFYRDDGKEKYIFPIQINEHDKENIYILKKYFEEKCKMKKVFDLMKQKNMLHLSIYFSGNTTEKIFNNSTILLVSLFENLLESISIEILNNLKILDVDDNMFFCISDDITMNNINIINIKIIYEK